MLNIAPDLDLPADIVTQAIAVLARKGAGKTYTASVLVEEVVRAKLPVVVLDPTGAWWGLRSSVDGERPGLPVVIFGGDHGDVPLEPTAGKLIADVVLEHPGAFIVDLSSFESKAAEQRFAGDFLERLYRGKKRETGPLLLVVDEADTFAPQRPGPEQTRTLGALEAIVRRGRIKGAGDLLITQRAAVLNKNVLTQTEVLVVMQTTGPQDRAAIDDWISGNGTRDERDEVLGSLASLERGEAWVWSPSFLRVLQRVRIRPRTTFDSSRTPEAGELPVAPHAFAAVDLAALGAQIAATVEQSKANDPRELRRRMHELELQVDVMSRAIAEGPKTVEKIVEVPVLNGQVDKLAALLVDVRQYGEALVHAGDGLHEVADSITTAIERVQRPLAPVPVVRRATVVERRVAPPVVIALPDERGDRAMDRSGPAPLGKADKALLTALVQFPAGLSRVRLSLISGYSVKSSSFSNALGALRSAGLVEKGSDPIRATDAGRAAIPDAPAPPTGAEILDYWRSRLRRAERTFLDAIVDAWPVVLSKEELSERTGYSATSSSFSNALGQLRSLELIDGFAPAEDLV